MAVESYIVVIADRGGRQVGARHRLNIPLEAARGMFEDLSDRALNDLIKDLFHEQLRRGGADLDQTSRKYDPFASQFTGD